MFPISGDSDLFGRLLLAAKVQNVDILKEAQSYEFAFLPISLAHPDGSLRKTTNRSLGTKTSDTASNASCTLK